MVTANALPARSMAAGWATALLLAGVVLATFVDAVAGTLLILGRNGILGDTSATLDEFAWLDVGYTSAKLVGYAVAPWILGRMAPVNAVAGAVLVLAGAGAIAGLSPAMATLLFFRVLQGLAGGLLLVAAQSLIFWMFPRARQPLLQALFAAGAVVAPGSLALLFHGWIIDEASWRWILFGLAPLAMLTAGLLWLGPPPGAVVSPSKTFDFVGALLFALTVVGLTYALTQGNRWDWFASGRIQFAAGGAVAAFAALVLHHRRRAGQALFRLDAFKVGNFQFAFIISFVAGTALFGSAFLLPAFAASVLGFSALATGELLAPSAAVFLGALFLSAWMIQQLRIPGLVFAPLGIALIMVAMSLLARGAPDSGAVDLAWPLAIRGLGLGFLFLALTLMAFMALPDSEMAYGIAMFDIARQIGGLAGVAGLQTLIERKTASASAILGSSLPTTGVAVSDRLAATANALVARGMESGAAVSAARGLLARSLSQQASAIAFDLAFLSLALLFVVSVPLFIVTKIVLTKLSARRVALELKKVDA